MSVCEREREGERERESARERLALLVGMINRSAPEHGCQSPMNTHPPDSSTTFSLRSNLYEVYNLLIRITKTASENERLKRRMRAKGRSGEKGTRAEDLGVHKPVCDVVKYLMAEGTLMPSIYTQSS